MTSEGINHVCQKNNNNKKILFSKGKEQSVLLSED